MAPVGRAETSAPVLPAGIPSPGKGKPMPFISTRDGTQIFYKDWGPKHAQPIVFHHGWPLSGDDWDNQMMFFLATWFPRHRARPPRPWPIRAGQRRP